MSVRVRFAPSPTGYLHIGGARTALYCYLMAKASGGSYVLRIEDTDLDRSKPEYEKAMIDDLKWLGIYHNEGPDIGGEYGPYRQSERLDIYQKYADQLVKEGKAYPCFLTQEELEALTEKAISEKKAPHFYHGKYRDLDPSEAEKKIKEGLEYVIRFKNPGKSWSFVDLVRKDVTFPPDMVGDFVIIRSNKMPVYNFCCVIDDALMEMTHVIRAEEHLNNTVRQLMIYDAIGMKAPEFAHVSLLVGADRQKLSKRHGATSVSQYRDQNYLPEALNNYLLLLGWSHPDEKDIFTVEEVSKIFDFSRFSKASAFYDMLKLNHFNGQHLRLLSEDKLVSYVENSIDKDSEFFAQTNLWKKTFSNLFLEKCNTANDFNDFSKSLFEHKIDEDDQYKEAMSWESTELISSALKEKIQGLIDEGKDFATVEDVSEWMSFLKKELSIKGKPLFMGMRVVLTGKAHGADLKIVTSLIPLKKLLAGASK